VDVGGTFTDVVAIDGSTRKLIAFIKIPTTHSAPEGVAAGIVEGIQALLNAHNIAPAQVSFIAHSTTQATNSLLEGDVAQVGVLGITERFGWLARRQIAFPAFQLAAGVRFAPRFAFVRGGDGVRGIQALAQSGAQSIAVSEPFAVDRPANEAALLSQARDRSIFATAGHEVSSMYGLRTRTRTAALNAAILPKMVQTARMTARAVSEARISAPLMIMRSDGGVMDVREVERRPILTMLSGPAAGLAGALLHDNVTDGIFIEVGGTSADCSAIRAGMPQMRPARIGGHRTMLRTLDVRTLGIAGGSMVRAGTGGIKDVGPRSAHIAGLKYACFCRPDTIAGASVVRFRPTPRDPDDYLALEALDGTRIAITPTCAANMLGYVPQDAFARGDPQSARAAFELAAATVGLDAEVLARRVLEISSDKVLAAVAELIADYELDPNAVVIVGGGGGAAALVPFAAQRSNRTFRLARDAEVISPVGVALALLRDVVERTIVDPSADDIVRIRREAQDRIIAAGAAPQTVDVSIEIDTQRNLVRATASGASALAEGGGRVALSGEELATTAAQLLRTDLAAVRAVASTSGLTVFGSARAGRYDVRVLDDMGVARVSLSRARVTTLTAESVSRTLPDVIEEETAFGDVGRALPAIILLHGARSADLGGLASAQQVTALALEEVRGLEPAARVVLLTSGRRA